MKDAKDDEETEKMEVDVEEPAEEVESAKPEESKDDEMDVSEVKAEPAAEEMAVDEEPSKEDEPKVSSPAADAEETPATVEEKPTPETASEVEPEKVTDEMEKKSPENVVSELSVSIKKEDAHSAALESVDKLKAMFPELEVMHKGTETAVDSPQMPQLVDKQNKTLPMEKTFAQLIAQSYQHPIKWPKVSKKSDLTLGQGSLFAQKGRKSMQYAFLKPHDLK